MDDDDTTPEARQTYVRRPGERGMALQMVTPAQVHRERIRPMARKQRPGMYRSVGAAFGRLILAAYIGYALAASVLLTAFLLLAHAGVLWIGVGHP